MPKKPPLSEVAVAKVRRYCDRRIRPEIRDKIQLQIETRGNAITIFECRPPWREDIGCLLGIGRTLAGRDGVVPSR